MREHGRSGFVAVRRNLGQLGYCFPRRPYTDGESRFLCGRNRGCVCGWVGRAPSGADYEEYGRQGGSKILAANKEHDILGYVDVYQKGRERRPLRSAIDGRAVGHTRYNRSQRTCKRVEEHFGRFKTVPSIRQTMLRAVSASTRGQVENLC